MRAIVLGNQMQPGSIPALNQGLSDTEPLVRGASAWALGNIGGKVAHAALANATETRAGSRRHHRNKRCVVYPETLNSETLNPAGVSF